MYEKLFYEIFKYENKKILWLAWDDNNTWLNADS